MHEVAHAGRGHATLVQDGGDGLKAHVVRALLNAMDHSLNGVQFGWNNKLDQARELYRNQLVFQTKIMSKEEFENVAYDFKTEIDPLTGERMHLHFGKTDF